MSQESRGTLTGRISDSSGASVANAKLHALHQETNTGGGATTNHNGNFEIPFLIPGTYRLTVEAPGFKKSVRTGIEVTVNDRITADVVMEVGDLPQSVTVSAESTSLDTNSASIGLSIDDKQIMRRSQGRSEGSDQFVMSGAFDVRDQFTVSGSEGAGSDDSDLGGMGSGGRKEDTGQN